MRCGMSLGWDMATEAPTDLEMTRLCAEAMGWKTGGLASNVVAYKVSHCAIISSNDRGGESVYDPLNNDAQAVAVLKRLKLCANHIEGFWEVTCCKPGTSDHCAKGRSVDLNRAIALCVVGMSAEGATGAESGTPS
jgi:hypothetical protein